MSSNSIASTIPAANEAFLAAIGDDRSRFTLPPKRKLIVVTCMDARVTQLDEPLGLKRGDVIYIRNAGGHAQEALRSIVVAQRLVGLSEIAIIHHTDCRAQTFTTDSLRAKIKADAPGDGALARAADAISFGEFSDVEASLKPDIEFLRSSLLLLKDSVITGWVYDESNGNIRQVA